MTTANDVVNYSLSLVGRKVTVPTNPYGGQCVALIDHIMQHLTGGQLNMAYTNAKDCLVKARRLGLPVVINDPRNPNLLPQAGDFFVMQFGPSDPFGHIGVCISANVHGMTTVEQNIDGYSDHNRNGINDQLEIGGGGITRKHQRDYSNVIGWFRLNSGQPVGTKNYAGSRRYKESGTFTVTVDSINVRRNPDIKSVKVATYKKGQSVKYDEVVVDYDGFVWISYVGRSGIRNYVGTGATKDGKRFGSAWGTFK
ncbi:TPA: SH3 domain-containing protein [Streptococcus suis]